LGKGKKAGKYGHQSKNGAPTPPRPGPLDRIAIPE